ncbi:MAG: lysylphosphatidylglycerol synthase transmembrane domain-containing protein [Myxococcales bacterium]|jgi:uncharacterized protein (TIRG00374 family)
MKAATNRAVKALASLAISAFFIWLTLRGTDLRQVWLALRGANYLYLIPYVGILVAIHYLRVIRWGILLEPVGKPTFKKLNSAGGIGFMALVVMPFRLGEFARPLLIAEKGKIRRSAAMASVVVERVVDGLAMAVVLIVALLFSNPATKDEATLAWVRGGGLIVFAAFFALLVFLIVAYVKRDLAVRVVDRLARPVSARLAEKLAGMLDAFIGGLKVVPDRRKIALFFVLTAIYWGINGFGLALLARGFGLQLELAAAFAVLGVLVVGVMIPAGPGMLGTFQGAVIVGMQLFFPDPSSDAAIQAYAWVLWAAQFGQQVLFGLYFLALGNISFGSLWHSSAEVEDEEEPAQGEAALGPAEGP